MIQVQGRYAWVYYEGHQRLLHVASDEPGDVRTMSSGGWVAFAQASKSEAQMAYDGVRCGPEGIVDALNSQGIPHRSDEERALVLVSVSHFQKFMQRLVIVRESLTEDERTQLLLGRSNRTAPKATVLQKLKPKPQSERTEKPLPVPEFSVHPGACLDQWGPMLQTGMIHEAFRALRFYAHDCDLDFGIRDEYRVLSVLIQDSSFSVTDHSSWPATNCRMLVASQSLPASPSVQRDRWVIPAPARFLIVDNYEYRGVTQITLLTLTETQVPFFLSGMAPQIMKLAKKALGHLRQLGSKTESRSASTRRNSTPGFTTKPMILSPYGQWQKNPAVMSWLEDRLQ